MNPENINDSIVQLKVPMSRNPLGKTFSYLLLESKTLIDTGVPTEEAYQGLKDQLKIYNLKPQDIKRVIIKMLLPGTFSDNYLIIIATKHQKRVTANERIAP